VSSPGLINLSVQIATAIVTDRRIRRRAMMYGILLAAAQCLIGTVLLPATITENPWFLILFWGSCLFFVISSAGLALLDTLKIRQQFTCELSSLKNQLHTQPEDTNDGQGSLTHQVTGDSD
jgi:MFS family permease